MRRTLSSPPPTRDASASRSVATPVLPEPIAVVVTESRPAAVGVVALRLRSVSGARLPDWTPGAHIDLDTGTGAVRQYSLCGDRWDGDSMRIAVRADPAGTGVAAFLRHTARPGIQFWIGPPRNHFPLHPAAEYLFLAGGIGITPLLPMLAHAEALGTPWRLLYRARTRAAAAFLPELATYGHKVTMSTRPESSTRAVERFLTAAAPGTHLYACGPAGLLDHLTATTRSWPENTVHIEHFTPRPLPPPRLPARFEAVLAHSGRTITVGTDETLLQALGRARVTVPASCHRGVCGSCKIGLLDGLAEHRDSLHPPGTTPTSLYPCVSRAAGPRMVLDL